MAQRLTLAKKTVAQRHVFRILSRALTTKLFIGGLSFNTTEDDLTAAFSPFGEVVDVKVIRDRGSQRPKGFGFIQYASPADAETAITKMNGKVLNSKILFVDYAKPQSQRTEEYIAKSVSPLSSWHSVLRGTS